MLNVRSVVALLALLLMASPALAQPVPQAPKGSGWIAMVMSIVILVAVLVASFMSSKRGHQD